MAATSVRFRINTKGVILVEGGWRDLLQAFEFDFVDKAPSPLFPRFNGLHDRVLGRVEMFGGVFVLR